MKNRYLLTLASLFIGNCLLYAQDSSPVANQVIPPSPNAAALQKFVNFPVQLGNGTPEISIPVSSLNVKGLSYPLSLSYHASGIQVGTLASNVGLGWALSANGVITEQANGMLDDMNGPFSVSPNTILNPSLVLGYSQQPVLCANVTAVLNPELPFRNLLQLYSPNPNNPNDNYYYLTGVVTGQSDSEPDLYTFSSSTLSGKFFKDTQYGAFRTIPKTNNRVQQIVNSSNAVTGYQITDGKGIIYYFTLIQQTATQVNSSCSPGNVTSSREYYLTKITTPQGGEINFNYTTTNSVSYQISPQYFRSYYNSGSGNFNTDYLNYNTGLDGMASNCTTFTTITQAPLRLNSITANNGTVATFNYATTSRQDLPANQDYPLQSITITNGASPVNTFNLNYGYFFDGASSPTPDDYRLKLLSVQKSGEQPYAFTYNTAVNLPGRLSPAIDHYGYFNGTANTTALPVDAYDGFINGGDRSVNPAFNQAGILTQVTYPTGGYTQYTYETNQYWEAQTLTQHPSVSVSGPISYFNTNGPASQTLTSTFTVPSGVSQFKMFYNNTYTNKNYNVGSCTLTVTFPNGTTTSPFYGSNETTGVSLFQSDGSILAGQYTVTIVNTGNYSNVNDTYAVTDCHFTYFTNTTIPPHNEYGGGVRVSQIQAFSATNQQAYLKKYEYVIPGTSNSSGLNTLDPTYVDYISSSKVVYNAPTNTCFTETLNSVTQASNSLSPLNMSDGNSVSYSDVVEYDIDKTQNGYTHYLFNNIVANNAGQVLSFPHAPLINYDWTKGDLLEKDVYKYNGSSYLPVSKVANQYNYNYFDPMATDATRTQSYGAKFGLSTPPDFCNQCTTSGGGGNYGVVINGIQFGRENYAYYSSWHYLTQTQETTYDQNGLNPFSATKNYYYDNATHLQVTRTSTTRSDGKLLTAVTTYPDDYAAGTQFLDDMKSNHLTSLPVEQVSYLYDGSNTNIIGGGITQYLTGGIGLVDKAYKLETTVPVPLSSFKFSNAATGQYSFGNTPGTYSMDSHYQPRVQYNQYDTRGNPLTVTEVSGPPVTYLWGYNQQYPIAEIKNAAYQDVVNVLTQATIDQLATSTPTSDAQVRSTLNALRTASTLQNAQVKTFTYLPQVGMTSMTDAKGETTYYEYDAYSRLLDIKNKDGNIIKAYCYNYAGQAVNCFVDPPPPTTVSLYAKLRVTGTSTGAIGAYSQSYSTYEMDIFSDAACTISYTVPSNLTVNFSSVSAVTYSNGNASTTSVTPQSVVISAGSSSASCGTFDVSGCTAYTGAAPAALAARSVAVAQPNSAPGGTPTQCQTTTLSVTVGTGYTIEN